MRISVWSSDVGVSDLSAPGKSDQDDTVVGLLVGNDLGVTVNHIVFDARPHGRLKTGLDLRGRHPVDFAGAEPRVVIGDLNAIGDRRGWPGPHRAIHFRHVRKPLIGTQTADLAGAVGKNQDILGHAIPPNRAIRSKPSWLPFQAPDERGTKLVTMPSGDAAN